MPSTLIPQEIDLAQRQGVLPPPGSRLVVGFSGGGDSSVLLHSLQRAGRWAIKAIHVDHGLLPRSGHLALEAVQLAAGWSIPLHVIHLDLSARSEDAARQARHAALAQGALEFDADCIALAHTADDQLETMLLHLVRGAGLTGLAAMSPREMGPAGWAICRPLLSITRQAIENYCQEWAIKPVEDPTNSDANHCARNSLRHIVLPVLYRLNPQVAAAAARAAKIAAQEDAFFNALASEAAGAVSGARGWLRREFNRQPAIMRGRILRLRAGSLTERQTDAALRFALGGTAAHCHLPGGSILNRDAEWLWLSKLSTANSSGSGSMPGGGRCRLCLTQLRREPSMVPEEE